MRINYITVALVLFVFASCNKEIKLESLSFDAKPDAASYQVGDTTIFNFTGKPDNITFYSGVVGKRYDFRERTSADGVPQLQFTTALNTGMQPNSLSLLVSSDFTGAVNPSLDSATLVSANWTDISSRAQWATSGTTVASGVVDLSDFAAAGRPVYIAFKYNADTGSIQNKWTIKKFSVRNVLNDGTAYTIDTLPVFTTVANYGNSSGLPGWAAKTVANSYNWTLRDTALLITGATTIAAATEPAEAWAITGPINLKKVTPDAGTVIQNIANYLPSYSYVYSKPGTYEAVFVASNINASTQNSVVKKMAVTVQ
jgi:hypothetical protein